MVGNKTAAKIVKQICKPDENSRNIEGIPPEKRREALNKLRPILKNGTL